jgi:hypothetical protein
MTRVTLVVSIAVWLVAVLFAWRSADLVIEPSHAGRKRVARRNLLAVAVHGRSAGYVKDIRRQPRPPRRTWHLRTALILPENDTLVRRFRIGLLAIRIDLEHR